MTYRHPQTAFIRPAVEEADEHFKRCCQTARALHLATMSPDRALARFGHPDKWREDTPPMLDIIEAQIGLMVEHIKAMTDFALSLEGKEKTPDVYFNEDLTDALWAARQRAEAEDA